MVYFTLNCMAQWVGRCPANRKHAGLISSQGTCLGYRPGPQLGSRRRQPINVSFLHWCFPPSLPPSLPLSLKINKYFLKNGLFLPRFIPCVSINLRKKQSLRDIQTGKTIKKINIHQYRNRTVGPGQVAQFVRESSRYSNIVGSIPHQGTYKNQPINA